MNLQICLVERVLSDNGVYQEQQSVVESVPQNGQKNKVR